MKKTYSDEDEINNIKKIYYNYSKKENKLNFWIKKEVQDKVKEFLSAHEKWQIWWK